MPLGKNTSYIIIISIIIATTLIILGIVINNDTLENTKYDDSCKVFITTTSDLTLNTELTKVNDHLKEISYNIPASDGKYNGDFKYRFNQALGQSGPSFDVYYDVDGYNAMMKIHTHCWSDADPSHTVSEVRSMSVKLDGGSQDILFSVSDKLHKKNGAEHGYVSLYQADTDTGFWFEVIGNNEQVFYSVDNRSGKIFADGTPLAITHVPVDTYDITICDTNLENCATDEIYINTKIAPTISCDYNQDTDTPSLICQSN